MDITVKLYGVLRRGHFKESQMAVPDGSSIQTVIDHLELSPQLLDIMLINGVHARADEVLHDDDILSLLPLLEGG